MNESEVDESEVDESEVAENLLPPPPERVGPYRLEDRIGIGGMGAVYRAYDERLERPVAIKHILPELAGDRNAWKRLRREAKAVARMNHPAIVQIYDIVEHDDGDWIVMELIDGKTLFSILEGRPLELPEALDVICQITAGLAAAHAKGVVHRDLKTENVMVTTEGKVKILDFGLAKSLWQGADKSLSVEGSILGTGRAMSPEQAFGDEVSHRSDLFSLGTLIYEVTTGEAPFTGSTIFRVLAQICSDPHLPPREANPDLPEELAELIDRLLEKDPGNRPASAVEILEALESIPLSSPRTEASETYPRKGASDTSRKQASETGPLPRSAAAKWQIPPAAATSGSTEQRAGEDTLWLNPARPSGRRGKESTASVHIRTLLRITFKMPRRFFDLGGDRAQEVVSLHDRLVRGLLPEFSGLEIDKLDDGFLLLFKLPSEAISYALEYLLRLVDFRSEEGVDLTAGAGIHLGEMHMTENLPADVSRGAKQLEVAGPAKLIVTGTAALADAGQILVTQMAYEMASRGDQEEVELEWVKHGEYRIQDAEEDQTIFEVGALGETSSKPPDDTPTVSRLLDLSDLRKRENDGRRRRWILSLSAAVAILALGLWWLSGLGAPDSTAPEVGKGRQTLAVLGFQNLSGRDQVEWLSTALAELFTAELAAGGDLRLVAGETVARMKVELAVPTSKTLAADTLRNVRRNLGTDLVLVGSYLALDDEAKTLRLQPQLQPTDGGETIFVDVTGSESELFELVSGAALELRKKLDLGGISSQESAAVKATLGANPEANRLYSEGLTKLRSHHALEARDLLVQAVAADPDYALAHAALSRARSELGHDDKARESARHALELAEDLPRASSLAIEGRFHEVMGRWHKAVDTYQNLRELNPDDVDTILRLAEAQQRGGRGREAIATIESLRGLPAPASDDPRIDLAEASVRASQSDYRGSIEAAERAILKGTENEAWIVVAEAELRRWRPLRGLGRRDEAEDALEEARRLFAAAGDRAKVAEALSGIALLLEDRGLLARAERLYRQALEIHRLIGNQRGIAECLNYIADLIVDRGELKEAKEMVDQAIDAAREMGDREGEAKYLDTMTWVLLRLGDLTAAAERARGILALSQEIGQREEVGWGNYYLGRVALARAEIAEAENRNQQALAIGRELGSSHLSAYVLHSLAEVRLAAGDLDAAKETAAESRSLLSELTPGEKELLRSRLLFESDELEEAVEAARKVARDLRAEEQYDDEAAALAVLATAQLAKGDPDAARETIGLSRTAAGDSQNPRLRLTVELAGGRIDAAAGDTAAGRRRIEAALQEAARYGFAAFELEARLALGELEVAAGDAAGRRRLEALAEEARERGFGLVARKASELITPKRAPTPP